MAKKNRYAAKQQGTSRNWSVFDITVKVKTALSGYRETDYEMVHGCTEDDAVEIAQALNYYNNRDRD